jgi:alkanesulfonate monooxygenase SsuD/methylene tetrahydromethanopterin reductase-like flavin-dependent oxidoreductase (luciferase family)
VEIAIGIARDTGLTDDEKTALAVEAAKLGYASAWTNAAGLDGIDRCERWTKAAGIATGVAVVPTIGVSHQEIIARTRALRQSSGGKFILGVGIGHPKDIPSGVNPITLMREHLTILRDALGPPIYLAAVGPQMLRLAGELSDGVIPNYMDPGQIAWARARIAEGAKSARRDASEIPVAQFVRVVVDEDETTARRALARTVFTYALSTPGETRVGTYHSMVRMGLGPDLDALEKLRAEGVKGDALADACPDRALEKLGAWGRPDTVLDKARRLSEGLDVAIMRPFPARPGYAAALTAVRACAPANWAN